MFMIDKASCDLYCNQSNRYQNLCGKCLHDPYYPISNMIFTQLGKTRKSYYQTQLCDAIITKQI